VLLSAQEIEELSVSINMKPGHKKKFGFSIQQGREELKREKEEQEKQRETEREEHEEQQKRQKAKRVREEEEQEGQPKIEKQLAKIERDQQLFDAQAKAQSRKDQQVAEDQNSQPNAKPPARHSKGLGMSVSKAKIQGTHLPSSKSYAAFISHKKTHSTQGDSSSTLARSLKVRNCEVYVNMMPEIANAEEDKEELLTEMMDENGSGLTLTLLIQHLRAQLKNLDRFPSTRADGDAKWASVVVAKTPTTTHLVDLYLHATESWSLPLARGYIRMVVFCSFRLRDNASVILCKAHLNKTIYHSLVGTGPY
jgi:hypothetical protein